MSLSVAVGEALKKCDALDQNLLSEVKTALHNGCKLEELFGKDQVELLKRAVTALEGMIANTRAKLVAIAAGLENKDKTSTADICEVLRSNNITAEELNMAPQVAQWTAYFHEQVVTDLNYTAGKVPGKLKLTHVAPVNAAAAEAASAPQTNGSLLGSLSKLKFWGSAPKTTPQVATAPVKTSTTVGAAISEDEGLKSKSHELALLNAQIKESSRLLRLLKQKVAA